MRLVFVLMEMKVNKRNKIIIVIICIIAIAIGLLLIVNKEAHTFSSAKWRQNPEKRNLIVTDLLNRYELIGMPECEIIRLLGEEDKRGSRLSRFKGDLSIYPPEDNLVYSLGRNWSGLDEIWFILSIENGAVSKITFGLT